MSFEARPLSNGLTAVRSAASRLDGSYRSRRSGESGQRGNEQQRLSQRLTGRRIRFARAPDR